jgi:sugar lactone lactonase YvrE
MRQTILILAGLLLAAAPSWAASYYPVRLDDPKAIYLTSPQYPVHGDGIADDTAGIQQAIDQAAATTDRRIVFLPQGRYRISRTIFVWPGVRVIGYGAARPVLLLGEKTPGYQDQENFMVFFGGRRPATALPALEPRIGGSGGLNVSYPMDANPGTFYSAMSNVDIEIGEGNPRAVGVRARYAQHCFLAHMDFRLGSAMAGIHDGGNEAEDLHFYGGQYGIITRKPSPGWQFTLIDTVFEGQKIAAIRTHEAGLTLIHPRFRNVPTAIAIDPDYAEELWVKDGRMENISGPAVVVSREKSPRTEINLEGIVCRDVPAFALFRESGRKIAGAGGLYEVKTFSHGLHYADLGAAGEIQTVFDSAALHTAPADRAALPELPPRDTWVNVHSLGVKGDGATDDTAAIRAAIAGHRALYFPTGKYRVTDTVTLRPDTALIGLHPSTTAFVLVDSTAAFQGLGSPVPVMEAPRAGSNRVAGIGIYTNGVNPRAVALRWMAGADSMVNDVRFLGGHGTARIDGSPEEIYNNTHTADPVLARRWDGQYPSLWVTGGGGGTFVNIWTPSTFAQAGMLVSDTSTEGRVYQLSSEHHVRNEMVLRNVSNWQIYALQTEEERGEGGFALPLEIERSSNITVANLHMYRVVSTYQPYPYAIRISESKNIRLRNIHCYSDSKVSFDNSVYDQTHGVELRQREFAWLTISGDAPQSTPRPLPPTVAAGAKVETLAGGFYNISGAAAAPNGDLFFVDSHWQKIYRWSVDERHLSTVRDNPLDAANLIFDKAGNLMVVSYAGRGSVYAFDPRAPGLEVKMLPAEPSIPRPGMTAALPVDYWRFENDFIEGVPAKKPYQFVSPDGTTFLPAGDDFIRGTLYYGSKMQDVLRAFTLAKAVPGRPFYMSDEGDLRTYSATVDESGALTNVKWFADQGGEGLAVDSHGNVYMAAGQILVYSAAGQPIGSIDVPERPTGLVFGGKDGKTLFILARTSLYALRTQ